MSVWILKIITWSVPVGMLSMPQICMSISAFWSQVVYLKAAAFGAPVTVKGIGLIDGPQLINGRFGTTNIEVGRNVQWLDTSWFKLSAVKGKNNVRSNTIYRETHPDHIYAIMQKIEQALNAINLLQQPKQIKGFLAFHFTSFTYIPMRTNPLFTLSVDAHFSVLMKSGMLKV